MTKKTKEVHLKSKKEWRNWLEKNHNKENKVYLIKYKRHTKKPTISHKESILEAICFGWIDTTIKKIDDKKYKRCFVKRNKNSRWSNATLSYAKQLIKEKKMAPSGLKAYKDGLKKPVIDHGLPKNPDTPEILKKKLSKNKKAKEFFDKLAPSYKRIFIYWVETAKRQETKEKRAAEVIKKCLQGKKNPFS